MDEKGVVTALAASEVAMPWWCSIFTRAGTSFLWDNVLLKSLFQWYQAVFCIFEQKRQRDKWLWTKSVFGSKRSWSVDDFNSHKCDWKAGLLQLNQECISSVKTASHPCNAIWCWINLCCDHFRCDCGHCWWYWGAWPRPMQASTGPRGSLMRIAVIPPSARSRWVSYLDTGG